MTLQPLPAQTIGDLLQSSPVLSGEGETFVVRSYFVSSGFTSELVLGMPCSDSAPTSKPGRPLKTRILVQSEQFQEAARIFHPMVRTPGIDGLARPQVTPGGGHRHHAR